MGNKVDNGLYRLVSRGFNGGIRWFRSLSPSPEQMISRC